MGSPSPPHILHTVWLTMSLVQLTRRILSPPRQPQLSSRQMSGQHDPDAWKWWKNVFLFVATPVIILGNINAFVLADPEEMEPPPFVEYDHLRIRTKKVPVGRRKSLSDSQSS